MPPARGVRGRDGAAATLLKRRAGADDGVQGEAGAQTLGVRLEPLRRVLAAARERYVQRGSVSGTARVAGLTGEERDALIALLGTYLKTRPGEEMRIPLRTLDDALRRGGWPGGLADVWRRQEGGPVRTRADDREALRVRREALRGWLADTAAGGGARSRAWLGSADAAALRLEMRACERRGDDDYTLLRAAVGVVARALDALPVDRDSVVRVPVFAREVTGDPHGLDDGTLAGRLLGGALGEQLGAGVGVRGAPSGAIERGMLLSAAGILVDGISSNVAVFGLAAATRSGGGADPLVAAAAADGAVLIAPLRQVRGWAALEPGGGSVHAVENPAVFEELADAARERGRVIPLLCTSGFAAVAALRVLDLAVAAGARIAYGGDFDANGLAIAASLMRRYGDRLDLWGMSADDYRHAARHPLAEPLPATDRERLVRHEGTPLAALALTMRDVGKRAYQEAVVGRLRDSLGLGEAGRAARGRRAMG